MIGIFLCDHRAGNFCGSQSLAMRYLSRGAEANSVGGNLVYSVSTSRCIWDVVVLQCAATCTDNSLTS